jgi:hypothetical protein
MNWAIDIARWAFSNRVDLWAVIALALALAWVESSAHIRRTQRYDAWWFFNLGRSGTRMMRRPPS